MFVIVEFADGIQVVPEDWLCNENTSSYWPPYTNQIVINKSIIDKQKPQTSWSIHKVLQIFGSADIYQDAIWKMRLSMKYSDIDSSGSDTDGPPLRKKSCLSTSQDVLRDSSKESSDSPPLSLPPFPNIKSESTLIEPALNENQDVAPMAIVKKHERPAKEFQNLVLQKLDKIIYRMDRLDERLQAIESFAITKRVSVDVQLQVLNKLPCRCMDDIEVTEDTLRQDGELDNLVNALKTIGGMSPQVCIINILRKLMTDELAEQFTWYGAKSKRAFKQLFLLNVISSTVRVHHPSITDALISSVITNWLKYAKQRKERLEKKHNDEGPTQDTGI